ncbi:RagB/SusD family nutrient uptake outer membrane protein [Flavihumibacter stibioxidans]|uniref:Carbohydrate-binding protein SusD n=1 Tax=Flavihumibacter stibioxidans TaxID=1834163 RepID=A0ABR7M6V0_9BACT|nr:RagB/SusD family nutrient uptake outer membrane protein [Flavihumibacter stibioxidans]MBC6490341.1 carbohydrate-binding protein SusD [Flavihumibacter stibioxidans]
MKRTFNILSVLLGLAITFAACSKSFLDEEVYSSYAPETLKDSLGFEASISGLHNHLSQFFTTSDQQGWLNVWQVGTDIAYAGQQQGIEVPYYNYALLNSNDGAASFTWSWAFRMINNANIIIRNVEDPTVTSLTQAGKNAVNGEARFFRAYAYNILATCFGDVPLVKEPLTAPKTDFVRAPLAEVNALIEEDLRFAGENLPDVDNVKGNSKGKMYSRANKAMAQQLLAEAYLRMGKNDLAEQQALAVINDGKFSLTTSRFGVKANQPGDPFSDMFIYGNQRRSQGNREAIWVMEMEHPGTIVGGITNNPQQRRVWGPFFVGVTGMKLADSIGGRGLGRLRLNNHVIYDVYEQEDMRNSPYNFRRQFWYNDPSKPATYGKPVPYAGFDTIFRIAPHTTKWYQFDPKDEFGFAMIKDIPLMRLGETYLLLAEALFRQGRLAEAAEALNIIRGRSNASAITASDVTLDFILDERIRELVGEENRRMTLMRTGTLVDRAVRYNSVSPVNQLTGIENKHLLMPVPQSEINLNKDAVLQQNPGY